MRRFRFYLSLIGLLLVVLLTAACATNVAEAMPPRPDAPAPVDGDYRPDSILQIAATGNPQLIEFFAYWCTICRGMKPTVHGLEAEYWGKVDFVYLDIDDPENESALKDFGFRAQPLFVLITPDGKEIARWRGATDANEFRNAFDSYLSSAS